MNKQQPPPQIAVNIPGYTCELVVNHNCQLGECPVWDDRRNALLWLDILGKTLHIYDTLTQQYRQIALLTITGSIVLTDAGQVLAASRKGFSIIDIDAGTMHEPVLDMTAQLQNLRFNDGKCDPAGRLWAGTMAMPGHELKGTVYMLDSNYDITAKIEDVKTSNGIAWNMAGDAFYYIDTPTQQVVRYHYNARSGAISQPQVVIDIPKHEGSPDGMTIDTEGMLWIALWDGYCITRWNPHTGQMLQRIELPVQKVTSCTFGGPDMNDLYITSARIGLTTADQQEQPHAGGLFVIKNVGSKGLAPHRFVSAKQYH